MIYDSAGLVGEESLYSDFGKKIVQYISFPGFKSDSEYILVLKYYSDIFENLV